MSSTSNHQCFRLMLLGGDGALQAEIILQNEFNLIL